MATTVQERCDKIIGQAEGSDFFISISGYKKNAEDAENHYQFGVYLNYPKVLADMPQGDLRKLAEAGYARIVSVSQAPFKGKLAAGEMTAEDVVAWAASYDGENFLVRLNEVKERAAGAGVKVVDSDETLAYRQIAKNLKKADQDKGQDWETKGTKNPVPDRQFDKNGKTNHLAWAKGFQKDHPVFVKALAEVKKMKAEDF